MHRLRNGIIPYRKASWLVIWIDFYGDWHLHVHGRPRFSLPLRLVYRGGLVARGRKPGIHHKSNFEDTSNACAKNPQIRIYLNQCHEYFCNIVLGRIRQTWIMKMDYLMIYSGIFIPTSTFSNFIYIKALYRLLIAKYAS